MNFPLARNNMERHILIFATVAQIIGFILTGKRVHFNIINFTSNSKTMIVFCFFSSFCSQVIEFSFNNTVVEPSKRIISFVFQLFTHIHEKQQQSNRVKAVICSILCEIRISFNVTELLSNLLMYNNVKHRADYYLHITQWKR